MSAHQNILGEMNRMDIDKKTLSGSTASVDDNICMSGMLVECGSGILAGFRSPYDATVVKRLKESGASVKQNAVGGEFGIGINSGAAGEVRDGKADFGIGVDTSGSIRLSAASSSSSKANSIPLFGYKPSFGAVSRHGVISVSGSFEQVGIVARNITKIADAATVISGHDPSDATSNPDYAPDFSKIRDFIIEGKKAGIPTIYKDRLENCIDRLREYGVEPVEISLPNVYQYSLPVFQIIYAAEASSNLARYDGVRFGSRSSRYVDLDSLYIDSRTEGFGDEIKKQIILGTYLLSTGNYDKYYKKARIARSFIKMDYADAFKQCDVIFAPLAPIDEEERFSPVLPANIAGLPAISIPWEDYSSIQLIGNKFDDANLLGFAHAIEKIKA